MTWKLRDSIGCLFATSVSAIVGAILAMSLVVQDKYPQLISIKLGQTDFEVPLLLVVALSAMPILFVLCVFFRLTLFKQFPMQRLQRAILFAMLLGPGLTLGLTAALMLTAVGLGWAEFGDWFGPLHDAVRGRDSWELVRYAEFIGIVFAQGSVLGFVAGAWFVVPLTPANFSLPSFLRFVSAAAGALVILFAATPMILIPWKTRSDRAACIFNCRNVQQAMRSHSGMNGFNPGDRVPVFGADTLVGRGSYIGSLPKCPSGGTYTWIEGQIPAMGELMIRCSHPEHISPDHRDW